MQIKQEKNHGTFLFGILVGGLMGVAVALLWGQKSADPQLMPYPSPTSPRESTGYPVQRNGHQELPRIILNDDLSTPSTPSTPPSDPA